jgi:NAD(P)-dependent dehydrogenase (short-subunit alcohol dehydrogenase family)
MDTAGQEARMRDGQVVFVTGGTAGVGRATVREFATRGYSVGVLARGPDGLEATRRELESLGARVLALPTDVADARAVEYAAEEIERSLGPIDVWVNNAMTSVFSPVRELEAEEVRRVTDVTYLGTVNGTLSALKRMLPRDRGVIIQVGSALAYRAIPLQAAYCGAKHAIVGFTESLRTELLHDDSAVQVCNVHLPAMNTPQFDWVKSRLPNEAQPVPPIYQPEVAARAIAHVAEHPRREMLVALPTWKAVLGDKVAPGALDHYLARNGFESQQTDEPRDPADPNNLWDPVPGDHGARGRFGDRSTDRSPMLWVSMHRELLAAAGAALMGLAFGLTRPNGGSRQDAGGAVASGVEAGEAMVAHRT